MELEYPMKHTVLILLLAASAVAASAQTPARPVASAHALAASTGADLPPGVPPAKGIVKTAFSLRYQDIELGTGPVAEPNKVYKFNFTLWLAANGLKLDSSYDRPGLPLKDKDGKPVLGDDGKPKLGDPQPAQIIQGMGRAFPGLDEGFEGMKIGGKRRVFIPWQLGFGAKERTSADAKRPTIPAKSDLILDLELVDVSDVKMPAGHPAIGANPARPNGAGTAQPSAPAAPGAAPKPSAPATPASPASPAQPATSTTPATTTPTTTTQPQQ
jgi:peptidylprolyl isomerase